MTDILMIIKTSNLNNDDRLKKEVETLTTLNKKVVIRAVLQDNNKTKGIIYSNISFKTYRLLSRILLPQKMFLSIKAFEMYTYFLLAIFFLKPNIVWIHNIESIGLLWPLNFFKRCNWIKKIVWDQHELPSERFFKVNKYKNQLQRAYSRCDCVISANLARLDYIKKFFIIKNGKTILNYPLKSYSISSKEKLLGKYKEWLNGRYYFITTGTHNENMRYILNICDAIIKTKNYCLIVMGPYSEDTLKKLEKKYGSQYKKRILFTNIVSQEEMSNITENAFGSIILYNDERLNNLYCAPNRLYQAILKETPTITGNNPPMEEIINKYKTGLLLNSDGKNSVDIFNGIIMFESKREEIIKNIKEVKEFFNWEVNNDTIEQIINEDE